MEVVASLSQGRTAAAQCGLFTYKSVPVIFEPHCIIIIIIAAASTVAAAAVVVVVVVAASSCENGLKSRVPNMAENLTSSGASF